MKKPNLNLPLPSLTLPEKPAKEPERSSVQLVVAGFVRVVDGNPATNNNNRFSIDSFWFN